MDGKITIRDIDYAYTDTGGDGHPVLFLHGWPDDRTIWRHQLAALSSSGFRAVALDWPAHGESTVPAHVRRLAAPELCRDLPMICQGLGLDRPHLVAHDYGATIAWEAAALHPECFRSFAAVSVGHSMALLRDIALHPYRYGWLVLHGLPRTSRAWYLSGDARRFHKAFADHPDADRILQRLTKGNDLFWTVWERANPAPAVLARHLFGELRGKRVQVPTLAIYGEDDPYMTPAQMIRSSRYVSAEWRHETLKGGHWLPLETPQAINDLLIPWMRSA